MHPSLRQVPASGMALLRLTPRVSPRYQQQLSRLRCPYSTASTGGGGSESGTPRRTKEDTRQQSQQRTQEQGRPTMSPEYHEQKEPAREEQQPEERERQDEHDETVRKHNQEVEKSHDRPYSQINQEGEVETLDDAKGRSQSEKEE